MKYSTPKKIIFAAGTLCAAASSYAQSTTSVTLYGLIDEYVSVGRSSVGTTTKLESGGESGSRLGFRGSEDLGGGTRALFTLESGIAADTGTTTQNGVMWGRQSFVGLGNSSYGTLTLGRQNNLNYAAIDSNTAFGTGLGGIYASGIMTAVGGARVDNSVVYQSPVFGGVQATVLGGLGEGTTGRTAAADLKYSAGPLVVSGTYVHKNAFGATQTAASSGLVTASYDLGVVKLLGQVQEVKNATQALATNDDRLEYALGAQLPMGPHAVTAMIGSGKTKDVANSRGTEFSVGYQYTLSKRTDLYAIASNIRNDSNANYTTNGATGAGPVNAAGHNVQSVALGIRHRF